MVDAGDLANVIDVICRIGERGTWCGMRGRPAGDTGLHRVLVLRKLLAQAILLGGLQLRPFGNLRREKPGNEGHHHHAAVLWQHLQNPIGHVARHVGHGARRRMREHDGRGRHAQRVFHRVRGDVRQIDEHAEPVHLADHFFPERRESTRGGRVGRGVSPRGVARVRQRHVAGTGAVEHPQRPERVVDGVAALHADQRSDPALLERPLHVVCRERQLEGVGGLAHHAIDDVDLLERRCDRALPGELGWDIDRPELAADPAAAQPRDVRHDRRLRLTDVQLVEILLRVLPDCPRVVVVSVDQRRRLEQRPRPVEEASIGLSRGLSEN